MPLMFSHHFRLPLRLFVFAIMLVSTLLPSIVFAIPVQAAVEARWIDAAHVELDGRIYSDVDPYDDIHSYADYGVSDEDCRPQIIVNRAGGSGRWNNLRRAPDGSCVFLAVSEQESVTMQARENKDIGAFKLSEDVVFAPVGINCDSGEFNQFYKKWGEDSPGYSQLEDWRRDAYFRVLGNGNLDKDQFIRQDGGSAGNINNWDCGFSDRTESMQFANGGDIASLPEYAANTTIPPGVEFVTEDGETITGGGSNGQVPDTCESETILSLNWLLCGILEALDDVIGDHDSGLLGAVDSLLDINTNSIRNNEKLQETWSYFRAIASFALVAVGLIMVISQAFGSN